MVIHIIAVLVLGLMCGSELSIAVFAHPVLNRQPIEAHIPVRAALAALLGRVMPFWFAVSTLLNLVILFPLGRLTGSAWNLALIAFCIQVAAVVFSLVFPVPINNRIRVWTVGALPADWKQDEQRWDAYHSWRTVAIIAAFVLLTVSLNR